MAVSSKFVDNTSLAQLLRECASLVERNEHSALLYKAVEALNAYAESAGHTDASSNSSPLSSTRPSFQRPPNKQSNLIANGWIEQNRRSKFTTVWKEVLASLVEARRPGEETTLWIQRETVDHSSVGTSRGKKTLEALHQIPMKWLLDVKLLEFFGDFRFAISVYNVPEDFIFRTRDEESCREWVATLNSAKEAGSSVNSQKASEAAAETGFPDLLDQPNHSSSSHFPDLDMNSGEARPPPSAPPMDNSPNMNGNGSNNSISSSVGSGSNSNSAAAAAKPTAAAQPTKGRLSVKELRAIAHGAGYDTRGMERLDLEKIAAYYAPVSEKNPQYNKQQQQQQSHQQRAQKAQDELDQRVKAEAAERARKEKEDERLREQQKYVHQMREKARKRDEKAKAQMEARKREEEMKRRQQGWHQQTQPPQQQRQQNHSHPAASMAESTPRRTGPAQKFESVRFSTGEGGPRRKHAFPSHQQHQQFSAQSQQYAPPPDPPAASASIPHPPPPQQSPPPPPHNSNRRSDPTSPLNQKYAKAMAANQSNMSEQDEQAIITNIKRNILITWALVPPQYNMLRPIDQLLASIQTVFPPFTGVATNEYFAKWKVIKHQDLLIGAAMGGVDETKLVKAVRKLRVFLHPDRLPREFDANQTFVCKMLWDVSNDAYEEFLKHKEDLDWVRS